MMTRTHWFLYLTTTFTFALRAAAGNSCPRDYPFAFVGGYHCCASSLEDSLSPVEVEGLNKSLAKSCNGGLISKSSRCCQNSKSVRCENPPCENHGTCNTQKCRDVSKRLFEFMDPEANPCQDFEQFACGKFMKEYQLPPEKPKWSPLVFLGDVIYERGKIIMEKVPEKESPFITDKFTRKVYKSCMDKNEIESNGRSHVEDIFKKLGGWPAVEGASWNGYCYKWWDADLKQVSLGLYSGFLLDIFYFYDFGDARITSLNLDQPTLGLPRDFLLEGFNGKNVQHYYNFMVESAKLMGAKNDTAYEDMKDALLLEIDLANISAPHEERSTIEKLNNKRTIRELEGKPGYPPSLLTFLNNYFASAGASEVKFDLDDIVTLINTEYAGKLSGVVDRTSRRAIANYQSWRVFRSLIPLLHDDAKKLQEEFDRKYKGTEKPPPRWKTCLQRAGFSAPFPRDITNGLSLAAGSLYAREYFTPEGKTQVKEMVKYLRNSFEISLRNTSWMDNETKSHALKKLKAMRENVAYHDDLLNPDVLNNFFKDLTITDIFFDNVLEMQRFWRAYYLKNFRKSIDVHHFAENQLVAIGNAFYAPFQNAFKIPAGVLHDIVYDPFGPKFKNYGGIGFIINHEITHGFDNHGSQYDLNGGVNTWMKNTTTQNFKERSKCMIYQYGNMTSKQANMSLNAINNLGENIGDNGGINAAYSAYEKDIQENGDEPILPGISLTIRQLFWLFYGQFFCSKWRKEALINQIKHKVHAPEEFRINVPLSNSPDFAKDYNCPLGSPLNPVKKCKVW